MQQLQLAVLLALAASCYCHPLREPSAGTSSFRSLRRPFRSVKAPAETISNYDIVRPIIIHTDNMQPHPRELWISIRTEDNASNFTLKLELNENLIPQNFQSKHYDDSGREIISKGHVNCFYHGVVVNHSDWTATMSTCHGLQGSFGNPSDKNHHYHIEPLNKLDASLNQPHAFYLDSEHSKETGTCGCNHTHDADGVPSLEKMVGEKELRRLRRQASNGPLFVEWILVNDNAQYVRFGRNLTATVARALEVANKVDSLFRGLNIRVVLKESITWTNGDQITVTGDANTLLTNFRGYQPRITTDHDSAMLLTGIDLNGGTVGIAYIRTMCSDTHSVGVTQDRGRAINSLGSTAAHELGHIFNMNHDDGRSCTCTEPSQRCLMAAISGWPPSTQWSSCSKADLNTGLTTHNLGRCLTNVPTTTVGDPVCGNGIREGNEACDCGNAQECTDPCCNANTCQLAAGAQCSSGACCNSTCQFKSYGTTCRAADGDCDIAEYCSGDLGECPADNHKLDGSACAGNTGYCYEGKCPSHGAQCGYHFGSGSGKGRSECYAQRNAAGDVYGNCGHTSTAYQKCASGDVQCGQLQCTVGNWQARVNLPVVIARAYAYVSSTRRWELCQSFSTEPGKVDIKSPGLVLDGTKCGSSRMCQDQKCTPISQITSLSCGTGSNGQVCSGNGQCNNHGHCACNVGFTGTTCQTATTGPSTPDVNECATNNGGCAHICNNTVGSFTCSCRTGYVLGSNGKSCNDINECSSNNGGCAHTCTNSPGSFQCSCRTGYTLAGNGKSCNDINECSSNNGGCAHTCTNSPGSFLCSCRTGYTLAGNGRSCSDINECSSNNGGCAHTCTNSPGSFQCSCRTGYTLGGNGRSCSDINECSSNNGGCAHTCTNSPGSFLCSCRTGYTLAGNGRSCSDIDECSSNNGGCAHTCTNSPGSFQCRCRTGYTLAGNGRSCNDINECTTGTHNCQQLCSNTQGSFTCSCRSGFTLNSDGHTCIANEVPTNTQTTTQPPTTQPPTTQPPTTQTTTQPPTTQPPTTQPPTTQTTTQTTTQAPTTDPCGGGVLTVSSGNFTTPNWPETYPINIDCEWTIRLPDSNKRVQFTFDPVFGLAGKMNSDPAQSCTRDYVKIVDGNGVELGKYCHITTPSPMTTSTNSARVVLHAEHKHNPKRKGFKITFQSVDP